MSQTVALITGAGGGIGSATALALARQGVAIVGTGRSVEPLKALEKKLEGFQVATLIQDMTAEKAPEDAVNFAICRFGQLDILINNAGPGYPKPTIETSDEMLDLFINGHLRAPFRFAREAFPKMMEGGCIINVSSIAALRGRAGMGIYAAVKAAQIGLTHQLAAEFATRRIRCNAVAPGVVATPMSAGRMDTPRFRRLMIETVPSTPPFGQPEDVAEAISYLCSPAARFVNSHVLVIDGGWSTTHFLNEEALNR